MAKKKESASATDKSQHTFLFSKRNYQIMLGGLLLIVIGCVLMIGKEDIYSFTKITLAPILIFAGLMLQIVAILYKGPNSK